MNLRQILESIAEDKGLNPYPSLTVSSEVSDQPHYAGSYFVSWALPDPPTQAEIDAKVTKPPPDIEEEEEIDFFIVDRLIKNLSDAVKYIASDVLRLFKRSPEEAVKEFPKDPIPYQKVIRSDLQYTVWTWYPEMGSEGEWLGPEFTDMGGVGGTANPGIYLRRINGMVLSRTVGIPLHQPVRITHFDANWSLVENGEFQVHYKGDPGDRIIKVTNTQHVFFKAPLNDDGWRVGTIKPEEREQIAVMWQNSTTRGINACQFRILGRYSRLPGE